MLIIREEQIKVFTDVSRQRFKAEMANHSREFSPRLCKVLGPEALLIALQQAIDRANSYGYTKKGPIRLYIEMMFLFGSDFDTDPQYQKLTTALSSKADEMERAEIMHAEILTYQQKVSGPEGTNLRNALNKILATIKTPDSFSSDTFETTMRHNMARIYPQKTEYIGDEGLNELIARSHLTAREYGFKTLHTEAMLVALMFTLGHGCCTDPLYPWISRTLTNPKITTPEARARRIEKKATTWLNEVLTGPWRGE